MKKLVLLLLFVAFINSYSRAGHIAGGEISWDCLDDGRYIFHLTIYKDCANASPYPFNNQNLYIVGNPLPRSATNSVISSILLKPDSGRYSINSGDISPNCNQPAAQQLDCSNGDATMQRFTYSSDTIRLKGSVPTNGWAFNYVAPCCRIVTENLSGTASTPMFSAVMYGNQTANNCTNSSPRFPDVPRYSYCRGDTVNGFEMAVDTDGDSLFYNMGFVYNSPPAAPQIESYRAGYNRLNPTPSSQINNTSISFQLDSLSGRMNYRFLHGGGQIRYYMLNIKVDEYRGSNLISSVSREFPITARDCPSINNSRPNNQPEITKPFLKGNIRSNKDTVRAGDLVNMTLSVLDTNSMGGLTQELRVQVLGDQMSKDYAFGSPCADPNDSTCAYLLFANPVYNSQKDLYEIVSNFSVNQQILWQTDCSDLGANNQAKTHRFYVTASDDFCPVPAVANEIFEVTVLPPNSPPCQLITSVDKQAELNTNIEVYPNPSNGTVFVDRASAPLNFQIFNIQGKLMKRGSLGVNQNQLELPEAEGLYFVSLRDEQENERTFKVIKQ